MNYRDTIMYKEILEDADSVAAAVRVNLTAVKEIAEEFRDRKLTNVVLAARGTSYHACVYFKYLFEGLTGIPCSFAAPAVVTKYGAELRVKDSLVIGVSQSGKGLDIIETVKSAIKGGAVIATVTNDEASPLAQLGTHLFLCAGAEVSVAATKTFCAQLAVLAALAAAIAGDGALTEKLAEIPAWIKAVQAQMPQIEKAAMNYVDARDCYVLARGYNYALAQETALKIQETTYVRARAYAVSDFHHGPFAVIDEGTRVILHAHKDECFADAVEMFEKLKSVGAIVTVFTDDADLAARADSAIILPAIPAPLYPFAYAAAAQLFACVLSAARGLNPDSPRGLKKVTITK